MQFATVFLTALALALPCVASLAPVYVYSHLQYPSNRYIVKLKQGSNISSICEATSINALYKYKVIHGFAAILDKTQIEALRKNAHVEYIERYLVATAASIVSQHDASWGLARLSTRDRLIDQNPNNANFTYTYNSTAGEGVDIYILDTGVYTDNDEFDDGRATLGPNFVEFTTNEDILGHGTHCAGIAAGRRFGVAKGAEIISVKVVGDYGSGYSGDILAGLNYVQARVSSEKPSVVSMSFDLGGVSASVDEAVLSLTNSGVHVIVSAPTGSLDGPSNAFRASPTRAPTAITVGSFDITDTRSNLSGFGCLVDIHAPGDHILAAGLGCTDAFAVRSGTSAAAAYVSGLVASLISSEGNISPADMKAKLKGLAIQDAIANIPIGTPNLLAQNGLAPQ